jgi:hypothetical protein
VEAHAAIRNVAAAMTMDRVLANARRCFTNEWQVPISILL